MLLLLLKWLHALHIKVPQAFSYSSTRMILAALSTLLFTIFLGPRFIKKLYELKIGQSIRSVQEVPLLAQLHEKKKDTPTMGGILILFSMGLSLLLWMDLKSPFTWLLLFTTLGFGFLGAIDDYLKLRYKNSKGLKGKKKLIGQLIFSSLIALYFLAPGVPSPFSQDLMKQRPVAKEKVMVKNKERVQAVSLQEYVRRIYLPFFKEPVYTMSTVAAFFFFLLVITGSSNAVNLTDGLDGLAAGCLVMVSVVLALFAFLSNHIDMARYLNILYIEGSSEIAVYLFAMAGACLGFLWYNGYPAQVFMGDTGSLALGAVLGVSSICLKREFLLALSGGIFVIEALSVILQVLSYRYRNRKRVFLCAPLHHHFEYKGWCETKVVLRFWILSLLFAMIAVSSLKLQ